METYTYVYKGKHPVTVFGKYAEKNGDKVTVTQKINNTLFVLETKPQEKKETTKKGDKK